MLAPGQKVPDNVADYTVRESLTFNIFLGLRLTDADPDRAKKALAQLHMYPYAQRDKPPKVDILDAGTKAWSGLPPRGMEYWQCVNEVIQTETAAAPRPRWTRSSTLGPPDTQLPFSDRPAGHSCVSVFKNS